MINGMQSIYLHLSNLNIFKTSQFYFDHMHNYLQYLRYYVASHNARYMIHLQNGLKNHSRCMNMYQSHGKKWVEQLTNQGWLNKNMLSTLIKFEKKPTFQVLNSKDQNASFESVHATITTINYSKNCSSSNSVSSN